MKKIFFDSRWLNSGGIGRFCSEIVKAPIVDQCVQIKGDFSSALSFFDIFKLTKITALGGYFISPAYNSPLFSFNRVIITLHDLMHINFEDYSSLKNIFYYNLIVKRAISNAPLIFTVSEFTKNEISLWAGVDKDKIVVLANGLDHKAFNLNVEPFIRVRPYFLYVGNAKPHKNLVRLIQAFHDSGLCDNCDLVLSGSKDELLSEVISSYGLNDEVIFMDGIDELELPSYYKGALATVVVSLYEGFCLPIVESMAVGTPVITSNVTAMPETAGGAALLVDPTSVTDISEKLVQIYSDNNLRIHLSKLGLERAKDFSWDNTRKIFDDSLQKVLG